MIALRVMSDSGLEFADKADGILYAPLCIRAKRSIPEAEPPPNEINDWIEREQKLIANVSSERQPLHVLDHCVQFVSVND